MVKTSHCNLLHQNYYTTLLGYYLLYTYNGKQITDNIMKRILELYDLDSKTTNKIEIYLEKDSLQNEKGLDRYIDQILTEKAERSI